MFTKRNKNVDQSSCPLQLKLGGKMLLPIFCTSIIVSFCFKTIPNANNETNLFFLQSVIFFLYIFTNIYNCIFLPIDLSYFNIFKFSKKEKRIPSLLFIIVVPLLGNLIQYIFMYAIVNGSLFPQVQYHRDDVSVFFFLFPIAISLIISIMSYIILKIILRIKKFKNENKIF